MIAAQRQEADMWQVEQETYMDLPPLLSKTWESAQPNAKTFVEWDVAEDAIYQITTPKLDLAVWQEAIFPEWINIV